MRDARFMGALAVAAAMVFAPAVRAQEEPPRGAGSGQLREEESPPGATGTTNDQSATQSPPGAAGATNDQSATKSPPSAAGTTNDRPETESPSSAANGQLVEPPPTTASGANAPAGDHPSVSADPPDPFPAHRLGYLAGGALALTGTAFGFIAQSEAIRAGTLTSARASSETLTQAREHAATANLCFVLAGTTALYALVLEFLPRPAADAASLAFRF